MDKQSNEQQPPKNKLQKFIGFLADGIWKIELDPFPPIKRACIHLLRFITLVFGGFARHKCSLHAASLTYFTLMAIVPVLCLTLLMAKTLGAGECVRNKIDEHFNAMVASIEHGQDNLPAVAGHAAQTTEKKKADARAFAAQAHAIVNVILDRVDKFDVKTLGWIGFALLVWSVVSTLSTAKLSFNEIWEVAKPQPFFKILTTDLGVCIVVPVFAVAACSIPVLRILRKLIVTTTHQNHFVLSIIDSPFLGLLLTLLFSSLAFAVFLSFMPNTKIKIRPALEGGLVTAILFGMWMKVCAIAQVGIAKSSALYGSFAILPIVLAWIYVSWEIILFGEETVYAFQSCHAGEKV